jgi:hypothetical protein
LCEPVNDELANLGVPRIELVPDDKIRSGNAAFNGGSWRIKCHQWT